MRLYGDSARHALNPSKQATSRVLHLRLAEPEKGNARASSYDIVLLDSHQHSLHNCNYVTSTRDHTFAPESR